MFSRVSSLVAGCPDVVQKNNVAYKDTWQTFWGKPGLISRDHHCAPGVVRLLFLTFPRSEASCHRVMLRKLVHAFVTSRLDYCNSLLSECPNYVINNVQLVQNAAARVLTRISKRDHISPVLASLPWLPVKSRIDFKIPYNL